MRSAVPAGRCARRSGAHRSISVFGERPVQRGNRRVRPGVLAGLDGDYLRDLRYRDTRPTERNPATPTAAVPTWRRWAGPRALRGRPPSQVPGNQDAKIRSPTSSGCTGARPPRSRATTCRANPATFAPIAVSRDGCRTRLARIRDDSARRGRTRLVLRWSATDDIPRTPAAATAVTAAMARAPAIPRTAGCHRAAVTGTKRNPIESLRSTARSHSTETMLLWLSRPF